MASPKSPSSQYENVVKVLNRLQGKKIPSYDGLHAFWKDPNTFLTKSLYGIRLIADAQDPSANESYKNCCGDKAKDIVVTDDSITTKNAADSDAGIKAEGQSISTCCKDQTSTASLSGTYVKGNSKSNLWEKSMLLSSQVPSHITSKQAFVAKGSADCWPSGGSSGGMIPSGVKRSEKSGIVIGMKGLYPFDNSMFPPLLWDGEYLPTNGDIEVVANWIDAGCPLNIEEENLLVKHAKTITAANLVHALARGEQLHPVSKNHTNKHTNELNGATIRKEISSLTAEEVNVYGEALNCMFQYNDFLMDERSYDYWARIHTNLCQHGWEQFLPWHRLYLYFFEKHLQDFDSNISLPYWDWAEYADLNKTSSINTNFDLGVLPDAFGCFLNQKGVNELKNKKSFSGNSLFDEKEIGAFEKVAKKGIVYNSGYRFLTAVGIPFEIVPINNAAVWSEKVSAIYTTLKSINPLWYPTRWPGSFNGAMGRYPTNDDINLLLSLTSWNDFGGGPTYDHHYGGLEKVHNGMHNFSGGTNKYYPYGGNTEWVNIYEKLKIVADPQNSQNPQYGWMTDNRVTAFDPLFWSHHSNVDRLWARWQEMHSGQPLEMDGALAPWTMTVQDAMSVQKLGYSYMRDSAYFDVSNQVGMMNFKSESSGVSTNTLDKHRKVEIKLHKVHRANLPNVKIRVFLNMNSANIDTPTEGNDHFIEEITTFHGSCYGGPGHCNLPLPNFRKFDQRMLHHHEPRNYKIDATQAVQKLLNNGEKDISVQMVILGIDGRPIENGLYMKGVSLNFLD